MIIKTPWDVAACDSGDVYLSNKLHGVTFQEVGEPQVSYAFLR
jgi:hypothetical protein